MNKVEIVERKKAKAKMKDQRNDYGF